MNRFHRSYPTGEEDYCRRGLRHSVPALNQEGPMRPDGDCDMELLAIAYVLPQPFENLYTHMDGWRRGTIFADLDKPYEGGCRK